MPKRTTTTRADKPAKPYPEFPLFAHSNGRWAKKIRAKLHYFGAWGKRVNGTLERVEADGWQAALNTYQEQRDDLHAGRTPRANTDGLTVGDLRGRFLTVKSRALDAGELTARTYGDYRATADRLMEAFGENRLVSDLAADDFEALRAAIAKQWGPIRLGNEIQRVRTVFKYGYEAGLIDKPMRYGPTFKRPAKRVLRKHRAAGGKRLFTAEEVQRLIDAANPQLRAMLYLGINCGFGNSDCATIPLEKLDLDGGWIDYPRPKTGVERRCPLWPETIAALREAIAKRPTPKEAEAEGRVFVTKRGGPWEKGTPDSPISKEVAKLLRKLKINGRRGLGFYSLRHTFRTIADATRDFPAARLIMGHADESIDAVYRELIDDSRLRAVSDHVREWLFGEGGAA